MKKRLLCIFIVMLMIVPVVLASCGNTDEKDKMKDIILGTDSANPIDRAYTLSLWIPTDAITVKGMTADLSELTQQQKDSLLKSNPDVYEFLKRVDAVEDAINEELIGRSFYTKIDIVPVNNEYYEEAIANKLASIDKESNPGDMNTAGQDVAYENEIAEEVVGNKVLYDLLYRPVDKNQLDIFLIRDYGEYSGFAQYISYVDSGYLVPLNDSQKSGYINDTGKYASINKLIRAPFLNGMKVDGKIYALPNNHLYADQYQYILVNKELASSNGFNVEDMIDFNTCLDFINAVGEKGEENVVPFVGNFNDIAGYIYADDQLGFGATTRVDEEGKEYLDIESIFDSEEFNDYVKKYKELQDKEYVKTEASEGETVAVSIFKGTSLEAQEFADDYYLIKAATPVAETEDIYSSMFAISTFSLSYDRSMKILNLLQSDEQIRTLLQYGINGEDYSLVTETVNGQEIEKIKIKEDTLYRMNSLYTGNQYYTYPGDNTEIDDWDYVKETNLDVVVDPFIKFDYYLENGELTKEEREFLTNVKGEYVNLFEKIYDEIANMSSSEYEEFLKTYNTDFDALNKKIAEKQEEINRLSNIDKEIETVNNDIEKELAALDEATREKVSKLLADYRDVCARYEIMLEESQNPSESFDQDAFDKLTAERSELRVELFTDAYTIADLNDQLNQLNADKSSAPERIEKLKTESAQINSDIDYMKNNYNPAYVLNTRGEYAELLAIYKKVLTLYK